MANDRPCEPYYSDVFRYKNGYLYCEEVKITEIAQCLRDRDVPSPHSPCFVFSKAKIVSNVRSYLQPLEQLNRKTSLNYAVKANMNLELLKLLKEMGCSCTLVSGNELKLCLQLGFDPQSVVLNGNGKQDWEIEIAVNCGCLLNVDSLFNLRQTITVCRNLDKRARVLLRVNPNIDPDVHQYNATGTGGSKFGVDMDGLDEVLEAIKGEGYLTLTGLHCHLGSTIKDVGAFRESAIFLSKLFRDLKAAGFKDLALINIGGGLGIPYTKHASRTFPPDVQKVTTPTFPSPSEIIDAIEEVIGDDEVDLILEPGRSLIGNAAILATTVLGVKTSATTNYIVVDGSMTEVIRPALYQAYHHIDLAEPTQSQGEKRVYQIVGPVCESGDFLGKERCLPTPHEGCCLAMFDVGAYCAAMASNYNMRPRPAEVLVDGTECRLIRRPDTFDSILEPYRI